MLCFHIYILNLHVFQILSRYFFLLIIPWMMIYIVLVVCSHTCVYDLGMPRHLLFLLLFSYIILLISFLSLVLTFHIFLFFYIWANTIWYLHSQVVCAKLSVYGLFIRPTPLIINILSRQTFNIISCLEWVFLLLYSTLKAFRYHGYNPWFTLEVKKDRFFWNGLKFLCSSNFL